jgi:putative acetyltransferase
MRHQVRPVRDAHDLETVRELFREYADRLGIDLTFQGFEAELAQLPGKYAPPTGDLLLARSETGEALGCIGLRPLEIPGACEVKRLYVRAAARGTGIGHALARSVVERATALGYREAMLDTLPSMTSAIAIYRALGFEPIPPYWNNPLPGFLYFGKRL